MATIPKNQTELSCLLGIAKSAVSEQAKRGMPVDSLEAAQAWRAANLNPARKKGTRFDPAQLRPPQPDSPPAGATIAPVNAGQQATTEKDDTPEKSAPEPTRFSAFDEARTRREVADANLSELKEAELRGQVIRADAVRSAWAAKIATVRDALLQIPSRLAPVLAAESDLVVVTAKLETELRQALAELSTTK